MHRATTGTERKRLKDFCRYKLEVDTMAGDYLLSLGCCGSQSGPLEVQGDWEHSVVPVEKEDPVLWQLRALAAVGRDEGRNAQGWGHPLSMAGLCGPQRREEAMGR
jgi:hypothetical protein